MDYTSLTKDELIQKITGLKLLNKELLKEKEQETTLEFCWAGNLGHWYWDVKANQVTFNPLKITTLGYEREDIPETVGFEYFTDKLHPDDYEVAMKVMEDHLAGKADMYELEYRIKAKDGAYKWYYDRGKITQRNDEGEPILVAGIVFDITDRKEEELNIKDYNEQLLERTVTDVLTGLKNRRGIIDHLEMTISLNSEKGFSIAMFDIDDFSVVNDTKGHNVGDKVLIEVAEIMEKVVRRSDLVGRYGGEEFMVIYPGSTLKDAINSCERIRKAIETYEFIEGCRITISGGAHQYQGESIEELINKADQNLYKAKSMGKNRIEG